MNCKLARTAWNDRMDGKTIDHAALDAHIAGCSACRQYVREMQRLTGLLDALRRDTESIASQGTAVARPPVAGPARWLIQLRRIAAVAAVVAICGTLWIQVTADRRPVPAPPTGAGTNAAAPLESDGQEPLGLTLLGESAHRFMAVAQPTVQPNVQVFRLLETCEGPPAGEAS